MNKVKEFWNENKETIVGTCVIVGGIVVATAIPTVILTKKHYFKKYIFVSRKLDLICWKPDSGKAFSKEAAKAMLDLNIDAESHYAIVKKGMDYLPIQLNGSNVLMP